MSKKPQKLTGRAVRGERGTQTWEWFTQTGATLREIDTARLEALCEGVSCSDGRRKGDSGFDPYNQATSPQDDPTKPKRRSLDDMRRLNEEIKAAQGTVRDKK